jgi:hypothetical protein
VPKNLHHYCLSEVSLNKIKHTAFFRDAQQSISSKKSISLNTLIRSSLSIHHSFFSTSHHFEPRSAVRLSSMIQTGKIWIFSFLYLHFMSATSPWMSGLWEPLMRKQFLESVCQKTIPPLSILKHSGSDSSILCTANNSLQPELAELSFFENLNFLTSWNSPSAL